MSNGTVIGDPRPVLDECWKSTGITMSGSNVGDLLNAHNVSCGWFQGGFRPTGTDANGKAVCGASHTNIGGATVTDYIPHHQPFQYYPQTANPRHTPPASVDEIGHAGPANHPVRSDGFLGGRRCREVARGERLIEDNWSRGRLGNQSFDARDASLSNLLDFDTAHGDRHTARLVLDPATGQEVR